MSLTPQEIQAKIEKNIGPFFDEAPCGFLFTLPDGLIIKCNEILLTWVGLKRSDVEFKMGFVDLLDVSSKIYYETHYHPLLQMQGFLNEITIDLKGDSGGRIPVLINSKEAALDEVSNLKIIKSTIFDISERRRYEKELLNSRQRAEDLALKANILRALSENLREASSVQDSLNELVQLLTEEFCDTSYILSFNESEIIPPCSFISSESGLEQAPLSSEQIEKGAWIEKTETDVCAKELRDKLRAMQVDSFMAAPIIEENKVVATICCFLINSTKRFSKSDYEFLQDTAKRIATEIERRELKREQLEQELRRKKMLFELQKEKDVREKFVAALSHDLRSPLMAASLNLELLQADTPSKENIQEHSDAALDNLAIVEDMITDLLDANKIMGGGPLDLDLESFDIAQKLKETINRLNPLYENRVKFKGPDTLLGRWNQNGIRRIAENLISNAVKYGEENSPIEVNLIQADENITLSVHNFGNPIPESERKELFKPYHQSLSGPKKQGWGLGLSLVSGLVKAHSGSIDLKSDESSGTTFTITLPLEA